MIELLLLFPALIQGVAMIVDEFYFHQRRGLGRWERIGHPIDTLVVLVAYVPIIFCKFSESNVLLFIGLAFFSSLIVTKDEFVHAKECAPGENWLHSILFIIHPLVFVAGGFSWYLIHTPDAAIWNLMHFATVGFLQAALHAQFVAVVMVFVFQTIFWNFIWNPHTEK